MTSKPTPNKRTDKLNENWFKETTPDNNQENINEFLVLIQEYGCIHDGMSIGWKIVTCASEENLWPKKSQRREIDCFKKKPSCNCNGKREEKVLISINTGNKELLSELDLLNLVKHLRKH